jgi:hypothetical protein
MNVIQVGPGRYSVELYLSQPNNTGSVNASVMPKEGYKPKNVIFKFEYGSFIQSSDPKINKLDGGWRLLDALNAAVGRDPDVKKESWRDRTDADVVQNVWHTNLYNKWANPTPTEVSENRKTFRKDLKSRLGFMPKEDWDDDYDGSSSLRMSNPEVVAARDSFNSLKNRGGKKKKKRTRKRRRVHVKLRKSYKKR